MDSLDTFINEVDSEEDFSIKSVLCDSKVVDMERECEAVQQKMTDQAEQIRLLQAELTMHRARLGHYKHCIEVVRAKKEKVLLEDKKSNDVNNNFPAPLKRTKTGAFDVRWKSNNAKKLDDPALEPFNRQRTYDRIFFEKIRVMTYTQNVACWICSAFDAADVTTYKGVQLILEHAIKVHGFSLTPGDATILSKAALSNKVRVTAIVELGKAILKDLHFDKDKFIISAGLRDAVTEWYRYYLWLLSAVATSSPFFEDIDMAFERVKKALIDDMEVNASQDCLKALSEMRIVPFLIEIAKSLKLKG